MNRFISACAVITLSICSASFAHAQTADDIIQKHIAATGGADNWKKIHSIKKIAARNIMGNEMPVTITILQGKGYRSEYTRNGMTSVTVITDNEGWYYNPSRGQQKPDAMTNESVKMAQDLLDIPGPLVDYKTKGNKATYLGTDDVEGTECYKLKIILATGKEETDFIDVADYSLVRTVTKTRANGKEQTSTTTYGNYEKLPEGIVIPMSIDNGGSSMSVKSVDINKDVDENIFKIAGLTKEK